MLVVLHPGGQALVVDGLPVREARVHVLGEVVGRVVDALGRVLGRQVHALRRVVHLLRRVFGAVMNALHQTLKHLNRN